MPAAEKAAVSSDIEAVLALTFVVPAVAAPVTAAVVVDDGGADAVGDEPDEQAPSRRAAVRATAPTWRRFIGPGPPVGRRLVADR
jgi:hypothetical protein